MCPICDHRPKVKGGRYCTNCTAKLAKGKSRKADQKPVKFATYQGHVVGFYKSGDKLVPRLLHRKPENLPKRITLDLNVYLDGFTRDQIKKLKATILTLAKR